MHVRVLLLLLVSLQVFSSPLIHAAGSFTHIYTWQVAVGVQLPLLVQHPRVTSQANTLVCHVSLGARMHYFPSLVTHDTVFSSTLAAFPEI